MSVKATREYSPPPKDTPNSRGVTSADLRSGDTAADEPYASSRLAEAGGRGVCRELINSGSKAAPCPVPLYNSQRSYASIGVLQPVK
ncbi:hypothetical protein EVAR_59729_1 [Eumeta japonica]|uniref:Uncharacterized protein n=1 Tax=Eumeta variegata TaxID=151549 RepID=A0A4C1XJ70_EUMVA|nr:hypothetical protein EVAR_59729_1 [Eumeta japonica]